MTTCKSGGEEIDKQLNVLLVEDDLEECKAFAQCIESAGDVRLVGVTNNAEIALEYVKAFLPDAIILDLELHSGSGNGIAFLGTLDKAQISVSPYILVITHNISRITHEQTRQLGADFIMVKSQEDYSAQGAVDFLKSLRKTIYSTQESKKRSGGANEYSPAVLRQRIKSRIAAEMEKVGISPKALGRNYLIDAIMHKIEGHPNMAVTIAKHYGKTEASVERAMQNAINRAWSTAHPEDLMLYYTSRVRSEKGVPTLIEFISHYVNKLKMEYNGL